MPARIPLLAPDIPAEVWQKRTSSPETLFSNPDSSLEAFHKAAAPFFPERQVLGVNSATSGLHLALRLCGVKPQDYVLCPTFTFAATVNAILYQQARPVFIDSESESWNMDPMLLEQALSDLKQKRKKAAAIVLVHAYGTPARIQEIKDLASTYKVPLVEDAAPALGSLCNGKMVGTFGRFGIFSFNYNKIATTAGGGLLVSENMADMEEAKLLANQARVQAPFYLHETYGYNYRMNGLAAELGSLQLPLLEQKLLRKKEIFTIYKEALDGMAGIQFPQAGDGVQPNYWLSSCLLPDEEAKLSLYRQLNAAGIESRMLWRPMHLQPAYRQFAVYENGVAEGLFNKGISLPSSHSLKEEQQAEVVGLIKRYFT